MINQHNHILYIDDDIENLHSLKLVFKTHYFVHIASNSKHALDILNSENIKLVLVDQKMPDISGLDLCKIIHKKYANVLCIIVTAHPNSEIMQKAINQGGIYQFIIKPWDKETLKQTIDNALEKYDLIAQNKTLINDLELKNKELSEKNEVLTITSEVLKENENELMRYNKELIVAKNKAEESDRLKTSFLANISHEIRTPLNGIMGFTELLSRNTQDKLSLKSKSYIQIIKQSCHQLVSIINDLIDISKIEAGVVLIKEDEFTVNELTESILRDYKHQFDKKHIQFEIRNFLNGELICTDKHKILQILKHLVDNALKYTNSGSVLLTIKQQNNFVYFMVKDTGVGINENDTKKIWNRFTQLDLGKTTVNHGNGVGLSLAKSFVEVLNGTISLKTQINLGSEFTVRIPYKANKIISDTQLNQLIIKNPANRQ